MTWLGFIIFCILVFEAFADYCGDDLFCRSPYRCCETRKGCCFDSMHHHSKHFRLQIWNMWYFWFLIIFMMMSCFGGCGYYRRRRLALLTQASTSPIRNTPRHVLALQRHSINRRLNQERREPTYNYFAYSGPGGIQPDTAALPPAYSEVVSQPGMYPLNKVDLPPYPGHDKPDGQINTYERYEVNENTEPSPPPYSEYVYGPPEGAAAIPVVPESSTAHTSQVPPQINQSSPVQQSANHSSTVPNSEGDTSHGSNV